MKVNEVYEMNERINDLIGYIEYSLEEAKAYFERNKEQDRQRLDIINGMMIALEKVTGEKYHIEDTKVVKR